MSRHFHDRDDRTPSVVGYLGPELCRSMGLEKLIRGYEIGGGEGILPNYDRFGRRGVYDSTTSKGTRVGRILHGRVLSQHFHDRDDGTPSVVGYLEPELCRSMGLEKLI